jgi:lipopolysaccharide export system ATP-binding protein
VEDTALIIKTDHLVKSYNTRHVVDGVSINVEQGSVVGLLGPNGAGKTTTFYMIVGIERPNEGRVYLDDRDITAMPMYERARAGIGYLPQEASIFSKMTVEDNIMAILETTDMNASEREVKMNALLDEFRLNHVRKSEGKALSGGERRRVEIARALATDPAFILLDEPFAGIDPIAVADIQGMIAHLAQRGIGVLITDHNVRETLSIVDKAYILAEGKILLHGDSDTIANDPIARKYYLGDNFSM